MGGKLNMDSQQLPQPSRADHEDVEQARARFWANYQALGGQDRAWFDEAVKPLLKLAMPVPDPVPHFHRPRATAPLPWGPEQFIEYYCSLAS